MLFDTRVAKLYNAQGELQYTGSWAGIQAGNDEFAVRLEGLEGIVTGRLPRRSEPDKRVIFKLYLGQEGYEFLPE